MLALRDMFFFFQAEDGIRDLIVTGVQTCALPISGYRGGVEHPPTPAAYAQRQAGALHYRGGRDGSATGNGLRRGDRKSVVEGKSVDLGGRRIIKKKKKTSENALLPHACKPA